MSIIDSRVTRITMITRARWWKLNMGIRGIIRRIIRVNRSIRGLKG